MSKLLFLLLTTTLLLAACAPVAPSSGLPLLAITPPAPPAPTWQGRPKYAPGELVDYIAQSGDTIPALARRFNTSIEEIYAANSFIPRNATTMPPGMPMRIPIYYLPLWSEPTHIFPDHAYVFGPSLVGFDASAFVASHPGWLKKYRAWAGNEWRSGAGIVNYVGRNFSVSPRLLLALLEYQAGGLSQPEKPKGRYLLGYQRTYYESIYLQLVGAANTLNNGYYGWRDGSLTEFELQDGTLIRPDPWQNAATVALQYYFSKVLPPNEYRLAISPEGFLATYVTLFGDPWQDAAELIPGSLQQPELRLPFPAGRVWTLTGGPHTGFGHGLPFAALDFAPPSEFSGCFAVEEKDFALAMADGIVVRSETGTVVLDLDGDGDERTGWNIIYIHVGAEGRAPAGLSLKAGEPIGYPSCEGGQTTGTHIHVARKYNGEWIPADGPLAFNLEGWTAHNGSEPYQGTLTKGSLTIIASAASDLFSQIVSQAAP